MSSGLKADLRWSREIMLDLEWAHAIAPGAQIILVEADSNSVFDLFTAVDTARSLPGVNVVSMSWGTSEEFTNWKLSEDNPTTSIVSYCKNISDLDDKVFQTPANHVPVTFVAASGDFGADYENDNDRVHVMYPAASPNVIAVGGTVLDVNDFSYQTGWGGDNQHGSGGGASAYY